MRKRDVSFGPRTQLGLQAWDTFMTLADTTRKLGISFYAYIRDRVSGSNQIPPMSLIRKHKTVCHADHEWACDKDGDGIREVHTNTAEGMWTDVRNYLRPFKGIHKDYLSGYVAMVEFRRNLKRISPIFIAALVALHSVYT